MKKIVILLTLIMALHFITPAVAQVTLKKLGQNTILLAFPYGRYNQNVLKMSTRLGYRTAVTVKRGSNPFFADPLTLRRTQILKRDMKTFVSVLKSFHKLSLK